MLTATVWSMVGLCTIRLCTVNGERKLFEQVMINAKNYSLGDRHTCFYLCFIKRRKIICFMPLANWYAASRISSTILFLRYVNSDCIFHIFCHKVYSKFPLRFSLFMTFSRIVIFLIPWSKNKLRNKCNSHTALISIGSTVYSGYIIKYITFMES